MKFLIMVYSNPASRHLWEGMPEEDHLAFGRAHMELDRTIRASGEHVASEGLADQALARRVRVRDGQSLVTDGPFPEVKEYLAGFYLVDCEDIERAVAIAATVPDATFNDVEIRPVMDLSVVEW